MSDIDYKEICEFMIKVYSLKEPLPYEEDWERSKHYKMRSFEEAYLIGYIDGQDAGIDRVLERIKKMMKK